MRPFYFLTVRALLVVLGLAGFALLGGCRSGASKSPQVPTTTAAVVPRPPVESGSAPERSGPVPPLPEKDTLVVIDSGGDHGKRQATTLLEASEEEAKRREKRAKQGSHPIVITNANLKSYATGQLTTA
ncbi:MAG TPA: hypothetical protein VKA53_03730, partial [Thermoanaerobaculia bacterium]|nr:hypothetical protein [Thermoanaerobaculia bacterium]